MRLLGLLFALLAVACGGPANEPRPDVTNAMDVVTVRPDVPFVRPDVTLGDGGVYVPQPGTCGLDAPAFCETFETGPATPGARTAELDPARWSAMQGGPWHAANFEDGYAIGPSLLPPCRAGLPNTVLPGANVLVCDPTPSIPTRHLLTATAAQNYGLSTYRVRQPFDFAARTGTLKLDMELANNGLGGWSALAISEDPSPAPSFDWEERGSGPRNGIEIDFRLGWCATPHTARPVVTVFRDYVQTIATDLSQDCPAPHVMAAAGALSHVEVYITQNHLEVWASDAAPDGSTTFPNFHQLFSGDVALPFSRGYVSLINRNHATLKYWAGSAAFARWDNVGFDGPAVTNWREFSAPDSLAVTHGLPGCVVNGQCEWRGQTIANHPENDDVCDAEEENCTFAGEGRTVAYVVPRSDETPAQPPARLELSGVNLAGATRARLALATSYPYFEWNQMFPPATTFNLRYRLNGGAWHDRLVTAEEANAFRDFSPALGGAGAGAGLVNQVIDVDVRELRDGTNTVEFVSVGTWTGSYRIAVLALDLVLTTGS